MQLPSVADGQRQGAAAGEVRAADLFLEQSTVKTHLIHLCSKLGVHSRTQAVARAPRLLG